MKNKEKSEIAFPLYSMEEFYLQQKTSLEPYDFKDYENWFEETQKNKARLEKNGVKVVFVGVIVSELEAWLLGKKLQNTPANVAQYVAVKLKEQREGEKNWL